MRPGYCMFFFFFLLCGGGGVISCCYVEWVRGLALNLKETPSLQAVTAAFIF